MRKLKIIVFSIVCVFCFGIAKISYASAIDTIPPKGEVIVKNATLDNGIYYVSSSEIVLGITASDDVSATNNLKMFISDSPISSAEATNDSLWQAYSSEVNYAIDKNTLNTSTIYVYLKDEAGNISTNAIDSSMEFLVTYSADGAENVPSAQKAICGLPLTITVTEPKKEGKYFMGWSLSPIATSESWLSYDTIEAKYITGDITLYAVWGNAPRNLSEVAKVGDYVSYPIEYQNVDLGESLGKSNDIGWRVLDNSNGVVKLISAGTPISYNKDSENSEAIENLTTNFSSGEAEDYIAYGFSKNMYLIFTNLFTKTVSSLTKADITKLTGNTEILNIDASNYGGVLNNQTTYYIASTEDNNLYYLDSTDKKINSDTNLNYGVRPVVTLINTTKTTGRNEKGEWEISTELMDLIPSIANAPVLSGDMKAVYWQNDSGDGETFADTYTDEMYCYVMGNGKADSKDSKWANAVTTSDGSYWVWIPRYAYKITYTDSENTEKQAQTTSTATISGEKTGYGNIDILFMYGTSNTEYRDENGDPQPLPEGYKVHPAFQKMQEATTTESGDAELGNPLGKWDEELEGIWVAKYEASRETSNDKGQKWASTSGTDEATTTEKTESIWSRVVSKPSVISWGDISESNIYTNSLNMHSALNSHEMKNSEWGAVAYLTQSPYGRNGNEVAVNQCSNFYTGGGPGIGSSIVYNSTYEYNEETIYNESGEVTTKGFSDYYAWNTEQAQQEIYMEYMICLEEHMNMLQAMLIIRMAI